MIMTVVRSILFYIAFYGASAVLVTAALIAILLVAGWYGVRKRVAEIHSTAP